MTTPRAHVDDRSLGYVPALDGLRAIAVAGVVMFHTALHWLPGGFLGVSTFFTLSGFLITSVLLGELRTTATVDLGQFWARRLRRLAPASLVVIAFAVLVSHTAITGWGDGFLRTDAWAGVGQVMNWHVAYWIPDSDIFRGIGPIGPYWSLAVEEQFYAAIALVFLAVRHRRDSRRWLVGIFVAGWVVALVSAVLMHSTIPREMFSTHIRVAELAAGCLLALGVERWGRPVSGALTNALAVGGLIVTLAVFLVTRETQTWVLSGGFALLSVLHVATIVGLLADGPAARVLSTRPMLWLGTRSYGIYLVHWPIIRIMRSDRMHLSGIPLATVQIAVSLIVAEALYRFVETPIRRRSSLTPRATALGWLAGSAAVALLALTLRAG